MNPIHTQVRALLPRVLCFSLLSLCMAMPAIAQEPDGMGTNDLSEAEVLARLGELIQAAGAGQGADMVPQAPVPQTTVQPSQGANRTARPAPAVSSRGSNSTQSSDHGKSDDRKSRSRRSSSRSRSEQPGSATYSKDYGRGSSQPVPEPSSGTNGGPAALDYSAFKIIVERNIFDPNRYPAQARPPSRTPTHVDSVTLVGTMSYDKGDFAFFDGTSSEYKKALKLRDSIAGYKVANITPTSVALASGTNELKLGVGMQLRREESGPWHLAGQTASYSAPSTSASSSTSTATTAGSASPSSGSGEADSDVIKRLMQRRQQE